jgi:hypothetical protein
MPTRFCQREWDWGSLARNTNRIPSPATQVNLSKGYTMFLQSPCGYACGDHDTSTFGQADNASAFEVDRAVL